MPVPTSGILVAQPVYVKRVRERMGDANIEGALSALEHFDGDPRAMSASECNSFAVATGLKLNKNEFENLFDHFGAGTGKVDMVTFLGALSEHQNGVEPVWAGVEAPSSPNTAHLALSGVSHIEYGEQYKPFPKHWGVPPNAQMKGHNGIMRELPGGYGKGNAPMAVWVGTNMEKDRFSYTDDRGTKPYPFGNYSL